MIKYKYQHLYITFQLNISSLQGHVLSLHVYELVVVFAFFCPQAKTTRKIKDNDYTIWSSFGPHVSHAKGREHSWKLLACKIDLVHGWWNSTQSPHAHHSWPSDKPFRVHLLKIKLCRNRPNTDKYLCATLPYDQIMIFLSNNSYQLHYAPKSDIEDKHFSTLWENCILRVNNNNWWLFV